jgi:hypothetical protein
MLFLISGGRIALPEKHARAYRLIQPKTIFFTGRKRPIDYSMQPISAKPQILKGGTTVAKKVVKKVAKKAPAKKAAKKPAKKGCCCK